MTRKAKFLIVIAHTLALLIFTWVWSSMNKVTSEEKDLVKWSVALNRVLLPLLGWKSEDIPPKDDLLFINVSKDVQLIESDMGGKEVITDRELLTKTLEILAENPTYKYILCDIRFEKGDVTPADSSLAVALKKLKKAVFPAHLDSKGKKLEPSQFPFLHFGLADYTALAGEFYKYSLTEHDSLKSLPVRMFEDLHPNLPALKNAWGMTWQGNRPCFHSMIIDLRIQNRHIDLKKPFYAVYSLEDFNKRPRRLKQKGSSIGAFLKNKIVVIGAFERDNHKTVLGDMAGTILLLNVYYSLVAGIHQIHFSYVLILLITFWIFSWQLFFPVQFPEKTFLQKFFKNKIVQILDYPVALLAVSILCYLLYGIHITVLILALYAKGVQYLKKLFKIGEMEKELQKLKKG